MRELEAQLEDERQTFSTFRREAQEREASLQTEVAESVTALAAAQRQGEEARRNLAEATQTLRQRDDKIKFVPRATPCNCNAAGRQCVCALALTTRIRAFVRSCV